MEFLIVDYSIGNVDEKGEPAIRRVSLSELWEELDAARNDADIKITVVEIGDCVLDWS